MNIIKRVFSKHSSEQGAALVVVMLFLLLVALISGASVVLVRTVELSSRSVTGLNKFNLLAEGAANRVKWIIIHDKSKNHPRSLGSKEALDKSEELKLDRFLADGNIYTVNYYGYVLDVQVNDAVSGVSLDGADPSEQLDFMRVFFERDKSAGSSADRKERLEVFQRRLRDYVDNNKTAEIDGMEESDYISEKIPALPRNAPVQYRQEILWILGAEKLFHPDRNGLLSFFKIVTPDKLPLIKGRQNFFSVSEEYMKTVCKLEHDELEAVNEAVKNWYKEGKPLEESLDLAVYSKIKAQLSFSESGFYSLRIRPNFKSSRAIPGRTYCETVRLGKSPPQKQFYYYESSFY